MTNAARAGLIAATGALLFCTLFFGGASSDERLFPVAVAAVALAAAGWALAFLGVLPRPRLDRATIASGAAFGLFVAWTGLSLWWSVVPDRSWDYLNRGLTYFAFAALGLLVAAALPRAASAVAGALAVLLGLVLGWALLGKAIPALFEDGGRVARLRNPIGYWNALALLADVALALALWAGTRAGARHAVRASAALLAYAAILTALLTYSRAGTVVAVLVAAVWLALTRERLESLALLGVGGAPALLVGGWSFTRHGLEAGATHGGRVTDGAYFAAFAGVAAAAVWAAAYLLARRGDGVVLSAERRRRLERRAAAALGAALVLAVAGIAAGTGGPASWWREFVSPEQLGQQAGRFGSASSSNRWTWWREAWQIFEDRPVRGAGAASFAVARRPIRKNPLEVSEPHSVPLQFASELGVVGVGLAAAAAAFALLGVAAAVRRAPPPERAAAIALGIGVGAYALHALVDYDWDYVAATGPVLFAAGAVQAAGEPLRERRALLAAALVAVVGMAAAYSLGAPWLAERRVDGSYAALERDDVPAAVDRARSAHGLDPFALDPLWAWAAALEQAGLPRAALRYYEDAVELQPENSETWYALGEFRLTVLRDYAGACYALDLAYRLDPRGPAGDPGGLLDQVKRRLPGCPAA